MDGWLWSAEVCGTIDVTLVQGRELLMDKKTKKSPSGTPGAHGRSRERSVEMH